jgi:high affinity Mn2+ porin
MAKSSGYKLWNRDGKIAVTGFLTRAKLGTYQDAIALAQATGAPADIAAVRQYRTRSGLSINLEQEVIDDLGVFARAGFASGDVELDSYTDIDRTVAAGLSLTWQEVGTARRHSGICIRRKRDYAHPCRIS